MAEPLLQNQQADRPLPHRALFVWSGEDFPFYARLAIESLLINAPDFEVQLHLFGETPDTSPHFRAVRRRSRVTIEHHDRLPSGTTARQAGLALLQERGGLLIDFGTLITAPVHTLLASSGALSEEFVPAVAAVDGKRGLFAAWGSGLAALATRLLWMLCPTTLQPELERFSSFRWLNRRWLVRRLGAGIVAAAPGAGWVVALGSMPQSEPPQEVLRLQPPLYLEVKPQARITDPLFEAAAWPMVLRVFNRAGDAGESVLRTFGPKEVVARQKTNRYFRAAYGIMCATGLQRYGLHSKNSSRFDAPQSDSGTADAVSSPDLQSLS
jgi:hypothetical protein